nr:immunoglobulin heavy chain junction region [Macaca mulatta]MOX64883.1 immunoglobulin heavy chain junction region [Macaca mulatta]
CTRDKGVYLRYFEFW